MSQWESLTQSCICVNRSICCHRTQCLRQEKNRSCELALTGCVWFNNRTVRTSYIESHTTHLLPPANVVCEGEVSVCPREGWYPNMHCRSPDPHPRGGGEGSGLQAHTRGGGERGVSRPTPGRGVFQHALRQAPLLQ